MEWVYEKAPVSKEQRSIYRYIERKTQDKKLAEKTAKLLSLYDFLKSQKFKNAKEIEDSAYLDKGHKHKIFNERTSKSVFRLLNQHGGTAEEAKILDKGIRAILNYMREYTPEIVLDVTDTVYPWVTLLGSIQKAPVVGPIVDIATESAVQATTTGMVAADDIGAEIAGPAGSAVVAIPVAIAGLMVVLTHILEDELGEALLAAFLMIPFIGPTLWKAATSAGKMATTIAKKKYELQYTPFIGPYVDYLPDIPKEGGKRFSTRKSIHSKWRKTIRKKSGVI